MFLETKNTHLYQVVANQTRFLILSDFKNKKGHTEIQSLTAYVIDEGRKYNLDAPMYSTMYLFLSERR